MSRRTDLRSSMADFIDGIASNYDARIALGEPVAHVQSWIQETALCVRYRFDLPGDWDCGCEVCES